MQLALWQLMLPWVQSCTAAPLVLIHMAFIHQRVIDIAAVLLTGGTFCLMAVETNVKLAGPATVLTGVLGC